MGLMWLLVLGRQGQIGAAGRESPQGPAAATGRRLRQTGAWNDRWARGFGCGFGSGKVTVALGAGKPSVALWSSESTAVADSVGSKSPAAAPVADCGTANSGGRLICSGGKPAANSSSSRSTGVSRSLVAIRNTSSRKRGRATVPSFQRKMVWRCTPILRANSESLTPVRRVYSVRSSAKVRIDDFPDIVAQTP